MQGSDHLTYINGQFVSNKVANIVAAIKEYEPTLDVEWLPPEQRTDGQAAYKIVHKPLGQPPYVLFYVKTEAEFDERVLMRIIQNDQRHNSHGYSELEAWEQSQRLLKQQKYLDALEEAADMAVYILRSPKSRYRVNKDLVIDDAIPFNIANRKDIT